VTVAADTALLTRVPDARRARFPLFDPVLLAYLSLILGPIACLLGCVNALALRRPRLALTALGLGLFGWLGFGVVATLLLERGMRNVALVIVLARLCHVSAGALLAWSQWAHLRGHQFLDGRVVHTLGGVLVATALSVALPWPVRLWLWGPVA
jgi:hypothetical protein